MEQQNEASPVVVRFTPSQKLHNYFIRRRLIGNIAAIAVELALLVMAVVSIVRGSNMDTGQIVGHPYLFLMASFGYFFVLFRSIFPKYPKIQTTEVCSQFFPDRFAMDSAEPYETARRVFAYGIIARIVEYDQCLFLLLNNGTYLFIEIDKLTPAERQTTLKYCRHQNADYHRASARIK